MLRLGAVDVNDDHVQVAGGKKKRKKWSEERRGEKKYGNVQFLKTQTLAMYLL